MIHRNYIFVTLCLCVSNLIISHEDTKTQSRMVESELARLVALRA